MSEGKREILPMPPHSFPLIDTFDKKCFSLHQDPSAMKAGGGPSDMTPLPDDFMPSEKDVVCSWARQNHRHGKSFVS